MTKVEYIPRSATIYHYADKVYAYVLRIANTDIYESHSYRESIREHIREFNTLNGTNVCVSTLYLYSLDIHFQTQDDVTKFRLMYDL